MNDFKNVRKILIFKLCCFGDTVFMTPAVRSLREQFPNAEIYFAHSEWVNRMVSYLPHLAGSIMYENVYDSSVFSKLKGTIKFIRKIRKMNFDLVLYGHRSNKLSFVLSLCGIRYRLGFDGTKYLTHAAPFRADLREYERYQSVLTKIGIKIISSLPELKKPDVHKKRVELKIQPHDILIGIFPGGGHNPGTEMSIKKWGFANYMDFVRRINKEHPEIRIIIFEGKEESERIEIPKELAANKVTIDNDSLACCDYFISGDTGSLHIAAAFGVSTISLFGPTDPRILAPANEEVMPARHFYIWKNLECSPCYTPSTAVDKKNSMYWKGKNFLCRKGNAVCMSSIALDEVFSKLEVLLKTHNRHLKEM